MYYVLYILYLIYVHVFLWAVFGHYSFDSFNCGYVTLDSIIQSAGNTRNGLFFISAHLSKVLKTLAPFFLSLKRKGNTCF